MATTLRMNNYYFCSVDHKTVIIPSEGERYSLGGQAYGRDGFSDGSHIQTSSIKEIKDGIATTASGSQYVLEEMHPDYADLLSAKEAGTPIIESWKLKGSLRDGYTLIGKVGDDTVEGTVTSQEGNYVCLGDTKYYVIWRNLDIDPIEDLQIKLSNMYCDLRIGKDFSAYMGDPAIKPKLTL